MIELFQMLCTQELQLCGPQRFRYSVVAGEEKLIEDLQIKKNGNERDTAATSFRRTKWRSCLIGWSHRLGVVMDGLSVAKWTMFWSIWAVDQLAPVIHMV